MLRLLPALATANLSKHSSRVTHCTRDLQAHTDSALSKQTATDHDHAESGEPTAYTDKVDEKAAPTDPYLVTLGPEDDPKNFGKFRKWAVVLVICTGALCATCASSMVSSML